MSALFDKVKRASDGSLQFVERSSDIPVSSLPSKGQGWAVDSTGASYVESDAISSPKYNQGLAFTSDGALYVTTDAKASTDYFDNGRRISLAGALRISTGTTPTDTGLSDGITYVTGLSGAAAVAVGLEGSTDDLLMETGDVILAEGASEVDISAMDAATTLGGTETVGGVQTGATVKITIDQIKTYVNA